MWVKAIKTKLAVPGENLETFITNSIETIPERSVLVIASKIFSYCENRIIPKLSQSKNEKWELAKKEADWWLDPNQSKFQCMLTIKGNWMFANAGIDESNAGGNNYILWPADPQESINQAWRFVRKHYGLKEVGLIMSDSRSFPLSWGVVGHAVCYCGFKPLYSYIGKPDLHGRILQMEQINIAQSVVTSATLEMGEGNEQTPLALVGDITKIEFSQTPPTKTELGQVNVSIEDDIYAPLLTRVNWHRGGGGLA